MDTTRAERSGTGSRAGPQILVIDRLAAGGDGVGRIGEKVAFAPLTSPGDVVEVEVREERRTWCRTRVLRFVSSGPARVAAPCPSFGVCGGCDWQHLSYPAQCDAKRSIVVDALRRIGRFDSPEVAPTFPSPLQFGYRHRARLHIAGGDGGVVFGFFRHGSHEVIRLETCPVLHPALNAVLGSLAAVGRHYPRAFASFTEARLDTGWDGGMVRLLLRGGRAESVALAGAAARALRDHAAGRGVRVLSGKETSEPLPLRPGPLALVTTGETFTQVNLRQNLSLVDLALELADPQPGEDILDLYCGLGNLALPAAARGSRVIGVDLDGQAVRQARDNARRLGSDVTFSCDDAANAARSLAGAGRRFDVVLLNPPRTGARDAVAALLALSPARIVCVSCDPATLARDAAALAAAGYALDSVRPLDLFPQTSHVETVTLFRHTRYAAVCRVRQTPPRADQ